MERHRQQRWNDTESGGRAALMAVAWLAIEVPPDRPCYPKIQHSPVEQLAIRRKAAI
jgi:hypothetical protein